MANSDDGAFDAWLDSHRIPKSLQDKMKINGVDSIEMLQMLASDDLTEILQALDLNAIEKAKFKLLLKEAEHYKANDAPKADNKPKNAEQKQHDDEEDEEEEEDDDDEDEEDEKKLAEEEMAQRVAINNETLSNIVKQIDSVTQRVNQYVNESADKQSKQESDIIGKVFDLLIAEVTKRKEKLIQDVQNTNNEQKEAVQAFEAELKRYGTEIEQCLNSKKTKQEMMNTQRELIDSKLYTDVKQFRVPSIKMVIDQKKASQQINEISSVTTSSFRSAPVRPYGDNGAAMSNIRSIINIQVGGCGNRMGNLFWETIAAEYGLGADLVGHRNNNNYVKAADDIHVYFRETREHKYVPRGISCDIDYCDVTNLLHNNNVCQLRGQMYEPGVWGKGHYTEGKELWDKLLENCIRKEMEVCGSIRAVQFEYSLAGGSGSGLASLIMQHLHDMKQSQLLFACLPSTHYRLPFECYNVPLGIRHIVDAYYSNVNVCGCELLPELYGANNILPVINHPQFKDAKFGGAVLLDTEHTNRFCTRLSGKYFQREQREVDFAQINHVHNLIINDITSAFRFGSITNVCMKSPVVDRNKIEAWQHGENYEPKKKKKKKKKQQSAWYDDEEEEEESKSAMHRYYNLYTAHYCPLVVTDYQQQVDNRLNLMALSKRITNMLNYYCDDEPTCNDRIELIFRGNLDSKQIKNSQFLREYFSKMNDKYPDLQYAVNHVPVSSRYTETSVVKMEKTNNILQERVKPILREAEALFRKKSFLDKYIKEGMEEGEFAEVFHSIRDVFNDYNIEVDASKIYDDPSDDEEEDDDADEDEDEEEEEEEEESDEY